MVLHIKNMVSLRCKMVVKEELETLGIGFTEIDLGFANLLTNITSVQHQLLRENLSKSGLELIEDKKSILVEKIKNAVIEMVHFNDELPKTNYSDYISNKVGYDYTYLSNIFSAEKGINIQHFIINHKIERVKQLLQYKELNLTEISYKLHYSSVAHLSNQFKKVTGVSPSRYNQHCHIRKRNLENI